MGNIEFAGFLFDDAGDAVNGATVNIYDRNTITPSRANTTTNSSGYFTISHGTEGRFDIEFTSGSSKRRVKYDGAWQMQELELANLLIRNPANTFKYDIVPAAIVADRALTLPLITGADTLVSLGVAGTFSAIMTHSADIILQDASDLALGTGSDALLRWSTADASAHTTVLALDNTNQSLQITDVAAIATDWGLTDQTHPTIYIHSNTSPIANYLRIGGHDGTTAHVDVVGGTTLALQIGGASQATVTAAVLNIPAGNTYQVNGTDVLSNNTLGTGVLTSSVTTVGVLNSGSITSGFGSINNGSSTITTTGLISGGSLDIDDVLINGTTIGHTDDTDLLTLTSGLVTVAGEVSMTTLDIGGTNVSSTAAELNILDGVTSTAAELNILDGVTSTAAELNILDGVTSTAAELNIVDGVTATAAEINISDGDTSATGTTVADADRVVYNDNGTMKQVAVTDLAAYFDDEITAMPNLVTTAATTVGVLGSGSIASGFGNIDVGSSTIAATGTHTGPSGTWDSGGMDIASGDSYAINGTDVLVAATLGSGVTASSLTSVGTLTGLTLSGLIKRDVNAGITAGTTQTQGGGVALTAEVNEVSTVANDDDTVVLPTAVAGLKIVIINNGANRLKIFPAASDNLGAGSNTALAGGVATGSNITFMAYDATNWEEV
jgi:hypothetical protein